MKRRTFFQIAALGVAQAFIAASPTAGADRVRRVSAPFRIKPFEWEEATVNELQAAMESGKESALSLAREYSRRIEEIDRRGPAVNAVIEMNPEALAIARAGPGTEGERSSWSIARDPGFVKGQHRHP
jgi:amidase